MNNFEHSRPGVFRIIDKANVTKRCGRWGQIRQGLTGHWQDVSSIGSGSGVPPPDPEASEVEN